MNINKLLQILVFASISGLFLHGNVEAATKGLPAHEASHLKVLLIIDRGNLKDLSEFRIGVLFEIEDGWHIYWKNPGDSGLASTVTWKSNPAVTFSDVQYPVPRRIPYGTLMNFGYENEVLLSSVVNLSPSTKDKSDTEISAQAQWVLCKDECIPGDVKLSVSLSDNGLIGAEVSPEKFEKHFPSKTTVSEVSTLYADVTAERLVIQIPNTYEGLLNTEDWVFLPEQNNILKNFEPQLIKRLDDGSIELSIARVSKGKPLPKVLSGLLLLGNANSSRAKKIVLQLSDETTTSSTKNNQAIFAMLCSAFIGGLILNLMPCVFPVLSLKVLEIVRLGASQDARRHSQCFAFGVVSSFVGLAGLLIALKSLGLGIGWGFQFQSPSFVVAMALLTFTIGLNLSGVFEFGLSIQNKAGSVQVTETYKGSFLSGVLATSLATPCTAPFMGSAIAYALAAPLYQAFLVFVMLGVGMSAPYVLIPLFPSLTRFIPRPGAWMEKFKQALAFPMYATTTWLLWVLGTQSNVNAVIACAVAMVMIGAAMWIFGTWGAIHCSIRTRIFARVLSLTMVGTGLFIAISHSLQVPKAHAEARSNEPGSSERVSWEQYSDKRLRQALVESKSVLIDFTAAWCLVCQINHATVLQSPVLLAELEKKGVVLLRADWTSRDSEISEALSRFGRSGVPLLVLMNKDGKSKQFESLVSQSELLTAIESLPHTM